MATYVLRLQDKQEQDATKRVYLWKGLESAGMFCRHVRFFRTKEQAERILRKVSLTWKEHKFAITQAFID